MKLRSRGDLIESICQPPRISKTALLAWPVDHGNAIVESIVTSAWVENAHTGERLQELQNRYLGISPDGKRAIRRAGDCQSRLYDVVTGDDLGTVFDTRMALAMALFSADGRRLSVASERQADGADAIFELCAADPASIEVNLDAHIASDK